ncbi:MAG: AmmeMemoRadiSam system protein A [Spirochaetia bacterium]|jgi:AmmeMemoRadiSam system protein A
MSSTLTEQDGHVLLQTAREAIGARLALRSPRYPPPPAALSARCGVFVTLKVNEQLRGCIGHITSTRALVETIKEVALSSAFEDPRFSPLSAEEWDRVHLEVSVLSPFEPITDVNRIEVGAHGILIRRGGHSGLLLPQVAAEQGWDRDAFLSHTCLKAGLPRDAWSWPNTRIEIFSAQVFAEKE